MRRASSAIALPISLKCHPHRLRLSKMWIRMVRKAGRLMCGIIGKFGSDAFDVATAIDRIAHRGPDGRGVLTHEGVTHGHCRLSLVDLTDASAQPFAYRSGVLSYVGELWNAAELRDNLAGLGHTFR